MSMSKKNYAAIKSAQEIMKQIQDMTESVLHKPTSAFANIKEVNALVTKWNTDFGDCDPAWVPPTTTQPSARQSAIALGAFVQS